MSTNRPLLSLYRQGKSALSKIGSSVVSKWVKQEAHHWLQSPRSQEKQCHAAFFESLSNEQSNVRFADPKKVRKQLQARRDLVQKRMNHSTFENGQSTQLPASDRPSYEQKKSPYAVETALGGNALSPPPEGS